MKNLLLILALISGSILNAATARASLPDLKCIGELKVNGVNAGQKIGVKIQFGQGTHGSDITTLQADNTYKKFFSIYAAQSLPPKFIYSTNLVDSQSGATFAQVTIVKEGEDYSSPQLTGTLVLHPETTALKVFSLHCQTAQPNTPVPPPQDPNGGWHGPHRFLCKTRLCN